LNTSAASSTERVIGPILSIDHTSAIAPVRETRPKVGRRPVTPFVDDGDEREPRVSVPMANPTQPAAVAEPGPADEPLEPASSFHGLFVRPPNHTSPCASSPSVSFAMSTAPAASRRWTIVASSVNC
jgi:hypothetical protein